MARRLRLGVIGLGRQWRRYRHILPRVRGQWRVTVLWDAVAARAEEEARRLGASFTHGIIDLIERDEVDAVLVTDLTWSGLWPVEQARRLGKPVFCAADPLGDEAGLERLASMASDKTPLSMCPCPGLSLARTRLLEHLPVLGPVLWARGEWQGRTARANPLFTIEALELLDTVVALVGAAPVAIQAQSAGQVTDFAGVFLDFADGQVAQLSLWVGASSRGGARLAFSGIAGRAWADVPGAVGCESAAGRQTRSIPARLAREVALLHFARAIREREPMPSDLGRTMKALGWLRAARQSLTTGRRVELAG